jgi:hypothetical protein
VSGQISGSKASQVYKDKAITWTPGTMVCTLQCVGERDVREGGGKVNRGNGKRERG